MMTTIHVTYARVRISFLLSYTDLIDVRRVAAQTDRLIDRSTTAGARTEVRPGLVTRVFYGTDEPAPWTTQMRNGRERLAWALRGSTNSSALPKVKKKKKRTEEGREKAGGVGVGVGCTSAYSQWPVLLHWMWVPRWNLSIIIVIILPLPFPRHCPILIQMGHFSNIEVRLYV